MPPLMLPLLLLPLLSAVTSLHDPYVHIVPSSPLNVTIKKITSTEIHLTWAKPTKTVSIVDNVRETVSKQSLISAQSESFFTDSEVSLSVLKDSQSSDYDRYYNIGRIDSLRNFRRKKRRRDTETTTVKPESGNVTTFSPPDETEVASKTTIAVDDSLISYVLFYEVGHRGGSQNEWEGDNIDKLPEQSSRVNNVSLTPLGKDGLKGVKYTLKGLEPYTHYRIWVCAYFVSPSDIHNRPSKHSLSPRSTRIVCLTDIPPPTPPVLKNLTCNQPPGSLFLQWSKPEKYAWNIIAYTIKFKELGSNSNSFEIHFEASEDQIEVATDLHLEIRNNISVYEVILFASSNSCIEKGVIINGTETEPHKVIMTDNCMPNTIQINDSTMGSTIAVVSVFVSAILILLALFIFFHRRCTSIFKKCFPMSYLFLEEGVTIGGDGCGETGINGTAEPQTNCTKKKVTSPARINNVFWGTADDKNNTETNIEQLWDPLHPPVPVEKFFAHTAALHADGDIGFSKEYELIQSKSSMLSHTSHHSQHPDNRHKNRYLNITAYDHSRVCLLPSSSCLCESGKEHRKSCISKPNPPTTDSPSHCDYVNANFIDGLVAEINTELSKFIKEENMNRKLAQKKKQNEYMNTQPTSELWISVDESEKPFNYIPFSNKCGINNNSNITSSSTSETKNLICDKSMQESFTNTIKGKLSLDLEKKDDRKVLTPNSDILANTCRLSINLDRKEEKHDEPKTERNTKELRNKKRSTSADTKDIVVDKKSSSRGHSKNSSVVYTTNDSPSNNPPKIEGAFLNIEFSGIVDSEKELQKAKEAEKKDADKLAKESEETLDNLDDLYVQIDGESYRVNSSWLLDRRRYIGTQGPTPGTLPAFWRMVWDHQVAVIVMITNLIERGRRKCDMYWPKEGSETYGIIQVAILKEDVMATYTVRTFQIKNTKINETRSVLQYHYTVWPDHGTPEHPLAVLRFREAARKAAPYDAGVILVHCSAGVGRTGTYIVLDAMLNHLRLTGSLNVFGFLCHVRTQRNFLVQTEEQYVFIHDALLEAIQSGDTEVPAENAKEYLKKLLEPFPEGYVNTLLLTNKCGPYGIPLTEKVNENQNTDSMTPLIKRNNSEDCDFALWSNINNVPGNGKSLDECRNDIVSVALQEAKSKIDSKNDTVISGGVTCNGDSHNNGNSVQNGNFIENGDRSGENSLKGSNNLDELSSTKMDEINPEFILDDQSISNKSPITKKDIILDKVETASINSANLIKSENSASYEKINGLCNKVSEESKASSVSNEDVDNLSNDHGHKAVDVNRGTPIGAENSNTVTSSISSDTNNHDNSFKEKRSNFSPGQFGTNQENMDMYKKDKISRIRNDDNYELLSGSGRPGGLGSAPVDCFAGSHRFSCQKKDNNGKKPKNLLEQQFKLITSFEPSKFHIVNACKQVNLTKNRRGCVLPIESGRVHLIPKPGVEGSDYINATWLQGHRSLREYVVTQHPLSSTVSDLYRMLWDHSCQILVVLSNCSYDPDCKPFWPTEKNPDISVYNYNIRFLSEEKLIAKRLTSSDINNKKNTQKLIDDNSSQESPLQSPSSISSNKGFVLKLSKGSQKVSPISSNNSTEQRKSIQYSPKDNSDIIEMKDYRNTNDMSENNFYKRQSSNDNQDEERLIPKLDEIPSLEGTEELDELKKLNGETKTEGYAFDKSELRIETMLNNDNMGKLSPQKQLSNGDALSPNDDVSKKSQPKSPSKISLKSLKINSPILRSPSKFKFDFSGRNSANLKTDDTQDRKSPQTIMETPSFNPKFTTVPFVSTSQLRENSEEMGLDCHITTTDLTINSMQDDYELKVKLIECPRWLADLDYDENSDTDEDSEDEDYALDDKALDYVIEQRLKAYKGVFGLAEYVSKCQDEMKNSPVVVIDKLGGARAVALCTLCSVLRSQSKDVYSLAKLHHGRRAGTWRRSGDIRALYEALAAYEQPSQLSVSTQS